KRARKPPSTHGGPPDRAPSALTGHSPTPLTAPWGRNPKRPPDKSPGRRPGGGASEASQETTGDPARPSGPRPPGSVGPRPPSATLSVGEKSKAPSGQVPRPHAGRGRELSEPGNHRRLMAVLRTAPPRP